MKNLSLKNEDKYLDNEGVAFCPQCHLVMRVAPAESTLRWVFCPECKFRFHIFTESGIHLVTAYQYIINRGYGQGMI